jgi:hypothetical protein
MKKFLFQLFAVFILCSISLQFISLIIIKSEFKLYWGYPGIEVYRSIEQSKKKQNATKLILGDSVSKQFSPTGKISDTIVSLACNRAISMCGQYILLKEYLENNDVPKIVELQLTPLSLCDNLDQRFTYHYFLKPFYNKHFYQYFDAEMIELVEKIPFYQYSQMPLIKATKWAPKYGNLDEDYYCISEVSKKYLNAMLILCEEKGIQFELSPMPVSRAGASKINTITYSDDDQYGRITEVLRQYLTDIEYYPDTLFIDGIHLKDISPFI